MKKKKVLFQSDYSLAKTGFGRNARAILSYLYKTGKYDIVHYCVGAPFSAAFLEKTPWKSIGTLPDNEEERQSIERDPNLAKTAAYGDYYLDKVVEEEKPDVYMAVQDIWGVDFATKKKWFNKIPSVIWTTLDSLPILDTALDVAKKAENYWIWSSFATKAMHKLGHEKVKTVHGALDTNVFKRLDNKKRRELRNANNLLADDFIIGFVFRNQLRKSVPNLLEGFKVFKDKNPKAKNAKLLLHTHFNEGWNIPDLMKEKGIDSKDVLATYVCKNCHKYLIHPFSGESLNCLFCKSEKSVNTANVMVGVTEEELNEIYNLMNVYCHPFTSGGQEFPIQEAKLAELITLVTSYSCGEEMCEEGAASLPLDWAEYREPGTQFIKASTDPESITKRLNEVFEMQPKQRSKMGKKARKWVEENFSVERVGKFIEDFLDSCPEVDFDFTEISKHEQRDPKAFIPNLERNEDWVIALYKNILKMYDIDKDNDGFKYWMQQINSGASRKEVEDYFRQVATKENWDIEWNKLTRNGIESLLDKDDKGKRIVYVMPESIGDVFLSTSLFRSIKETYPEYNLYVATKPPFESVLNGNEYVHKVIPYTQEMENILFLEGKDKHEGFFEIAFMPFINTQRQMNYPHNGKDRIAFKDYKYT